MESKCFYNELFLKDSQLCGLFYTFCHQLDLSIWGQKMALIKHIFTVSCKKYTHFNFCQFFQDCIFLVRACLF